MVVETKLRTSGKWLIRCKGSGTIELSDLTSENIVIPGELVSELLVNSLRVIRNYELFNDIIAPWGENYLGYSFVTMLGEVSGEKFCMLLVFNARGDFKVVASTHGKRTHRLIRELNDSTDARVIMSV